MKKRFVKDKVCVSPLNQTFALQLMVVTYRRRPTAIKQVSILRSHENMTPTQNLVTFFGFIAEKDYREY